MCHFLSYSSIYYLRKFQLQHFSFITLSTHYISQYRNKYPYFLFLSFFASVITAMVMSLSFNSSQNSASFRISSLTFHVPRFICLRMLTQFSLTFLVRQSLNPADVLEERECFENVSSTRHHPDTWWDYHLLAQ